MFEKGIHKHISDSQSGVKKHALLLTVRFEGENGGAFQIPACGHGGIGEYFPFDWIVDWGDGASERIKGVSSPNGGEVATGNLIHSYAASGEYSVAISPAGLVSETTGNTPGWLQAFGHPEGYYPVGGFDKIVCVDGVLDDCAINIELEGACAYMFSHCNNITMGPHFTFSSNKKTAGDYFCFEMFSCCSGDAFTMGEAFQLPQNLREVGNAFCCKMFLLCTGSSFTMNGEFTIPPGIYVAGRSFCQEMFGEHGPALTMGKCFNLPQGISEADDNFCAAMFSNVGGEKPTFSMNDIFNLPPSITGNVGKSFCERMFAFNDGDDFRMNNRFNLPHGITSAGDAFCKSMFLRCSGSSFSMNDVFTMPPHLQDAGSECCMLMFSECNGHGFYVGEGFDFPYTLNGRGYLLFEMFGQCRIDSLNWAVRDMDERNPSLHIWSPPYDQIQW
ncbi:hypothetical protein [uncultured Enorma sp.]|uniref:hypothetical protein n=1 Tax=uncultured Enorma sp. TaxID=1714346 RepID=UPI00280393BC|nr:hypothetical protein [uncultured Enorma sp.]